MKPQTLTRARLRNLYLQHNCVEWKKEIEYILTNAPHTHDDDLITIPQESIDKLLNMGSIEQKMSVMNAGIKLSKSVIVPSREIGTEGLDWLIATRHSGKYENKAFVLNTEFNWEIKKDAYGITCLIPTMK